MANSDNKITAPVRLTQDVATVVGCGSDLGSACTSSNINRWSRCKPFTSVSTSFTTDDGTSGTYLTDREKARQYDMYALSPVSLPKALAKIYARTDTPSGLSYTIDEAIAQISRWTYTPPTGTIGVAPYRLLDFAGYNHNAIAPDKGWEDFGLDSTALTTILNIANNVTVSGSAPSSTAGSGYTFLPKKTGASTGVYENRYLYTLFSAALYVGSQYRIGPDYDPNMEIPLAAIVGSIQNGEDWRFALLVEYSGVAVSGTGSFFLIPARENFYTWYHKSTRSDRDIFPDFACNPAAGFLLNAIMSSVSSVRMIPVLVKNVTYTQVTLGVARFVPVLSSSSLIYCMPSAQGALTLTLGTFTPNYFDTTITAVSGTTYVYLHNFDAEASHTAVWNIYVNGTAVVTGASRTFTADESVSIYSRTTSSTEIVTCSITSQS